MSVDVVVMCMKYTHTHMCVCTQMAALQKQINDSNQLEKARITSLQQASVHTSRTPRTPQQTPWASPHPLPTSLHSNRNMTLKSEPAHMLHATLNSSIPRTRPRSHSRESASPPPGQNATAPMTQSAGPTTQSAGRVCHSVVLARADAHSSGIS